MTEYVTTEGFAALDALFDELAKPATRRASARRALGKAAEPMAAIANSLKPDDPATSGAEDSIHVGIGTRLTPRQRLQHRRLTRDDRAGVELFVGITAPRGASAADPAGVQQEFGNVNHPPQPFMRPAWDQDHRALLGRLAVELGKDLERSIQRARRRAARDSR
ncbi:HK97 gp10 family phage protein [Nioella sp.]|uniref:HK97 gp10 family phage protein n=1 Tax=Nioella sp. TaxID=1912091 RepID=UPI003514F271